MTDSALLLTLGPEDAHVDIGWAHYQPVYAGWLPGRGWLVTDSLRTMHAAGYARQLDHDRLMARIRREEWPLGFMAYEAGIHTLHNGLAYYLDPAGKIDVTGSAQRRHGPPPPRLNSALLEDILRCSVRALAGRNVGLLLSGGLDSALVAALLAAENVPFRAACVSNSRNQRDVENALAVCSELGIDLAAAEPTLDDYLMALPIAASVFEDARPDVYQALGLIFGARALGGSCDLLMGGEPADDVLRSSREFFEARSPAHREYLWAECLRDTIPRSIYLTKCAASHIGAGSSSPYSDDALIAAASNTPWDELQDPDLAEWKGPMSGDGFKPLQKQVARRLGVRSLDAICQTPKIGLPHSAQGHWLKLKSLLGGDSEHETLRRLWILSGSIYEAVVCHGQEPAAIDVMELIARARRRI